MSEDLDSIRTEGMLRQAEAFSETFLDALTDEVAVLDSSGRIVAVNEVWKQFARSNGDGSLASTGIGQNYLDTCLNAAGAGDHDAATVLDGLRAVLRKETKQFVFEYECSSPQERRWFLLTATSLAQQPGALVSHRDITQRKKAQAVLQLSGQMLAPSPLFDSFIPALVKNLSIVLGTRHAFLSELVDPTKGTARLLAHWHGTGYGPLREYSMRGIPAERTLFGESCLYPTGLQKLFPDDPRLRDIDADSYAAVPLLASGGESLGHLGIIDSRRMADPSFVEMTLKVFAARVAPELERRKAERRLADRSRLIEDAPDAIIATDINLAITFWNKAAEEMYGWRSEEALGLNARELLQTQSTGEQHSETMQTLFDTGGVRVARTQHHKNGSRLQVELVGLASRDEGGTIQGFVFAARDMSERAAMEDALRQAEYRQRVILDAIPDLIFTLDGRGVFLSFTPARNIEPLVPPSEFIGKQVGEVLPAHLAARILSAIHACVGSGELQVIEFDLTREDEVSHYEARLVLLGPNEVLAVVRDFSSEWRLERAAEERLVQPPVARTGGKPCILILDEDLQALRLLRNTLEAAGNRTIAMSDPGEAIGALETENPDAVLLNVAPASSDGMVAFRQISRLSSAPIIALAPSDSVDEAISALKMGADDYIIRPFSPAELSARVEATLRRHQAPQRVLLKPLEFGPLGIDPARRLVTLFGNPVTLTATEYKLLWSLAESVGRVLTHDEILERVWGPGYAGQYELVRSFIRSLRRKLDDDARQPRFILSERSIGYRLAKGA